MLTALGSLTDWIFGFHIYKTEIMTCNRSVGGTKVIAVLHIMVRVSVWMEKLCRYRFHSLNLLKEKEAIMG